MPKSWVVWRDKPVPKSRPSKAKSQLDEAAKLRGIMMGLGMADDINAEDGKLGEWFKFEKYF